MQAYFCIRQAAACCGGISEMDKKLISKYIQPLLPIETEIAPGGCMRGPVKAILFDIYGTLFISASGGSRPQHLGSNRRAALQHLLTRHDLQMTVASLLSLLQLEIESQHACSRDRGIDHPEVDILAVWRQVLPIKESEGIRRFALEFEFIVNPVFPMPNLDRFLASCARKVTVMGIISNAQFYTPFLFEWLLDADLSRLGFEPELVLMSFEQGRAKPSLVLFESAVELLGKRGIGPEEVLYVGNDMLKDIYPASVCRFQCALFAGDQRSLRLHRGDPRCRNLKPDLIITQLEQLLPHLGDQLAG